MIFIDLLKDEYIEELSDFVYKLRNNFLFQNKFDSNLAKNRTTIIKSLKKQISRKNHFVIFEETKLIGYLVLDLDDKELLIKEIYLDKINKSILYKIFRFYLRLFLKNNSNLSNGILSVLSYKSMCSASSTTYNSLGSEALLNASSLKNLE